MALLAVVMTTACQDDELVKQDHNPAQVGDEIMFGARAGFENSDPKSRTVYSDETYDVGTGDNKKTFERIDWIDGTDMIEVYCPQASNGPTSHYVINHAKDHDTQKDYAYLTRISDSSLQWGEADVHNFYAMYPSSQMFATDQSTLAQGVKMNGAKLTGIIPGSQAPVSITETNGNYVVAPDMKYAYMAAKASASRFDADGNQNGISLTFFPIVTAAEIQLTVPASTTSGTGTVVPVTIGEIQVVGTGIAGTFIADLAGWTSTYPTCTNEEGGTDVIQISTWKDNKPLTLAAGKSLTFTVFLRPGADVKNLKVQISPTGSGYVGKTLTDVTIPKNLKTVITNLKLPATGVEIDASKWMSQLSGDLALKKLSIPGTGGSFTHAYSNESYKQQSVVALSDGEDVIDQWKLGIRAFEIASDRPRYGTTSLGEEYVKCNSTSMGVRVYDVLTDLITKVTENPTETAVLILTYQPEGAWDGFSERNRNANTYAQSLRVLYDGTTDGTTTSTTDYKLTEDQRNHLIQYKPDLTLAEARGNVMVFCRINQKDESDGGSFSEASTILAGTNITLVDGCGTGKDRWGSRGYKVQGNVAYDAANTSDATKSVDYWMQFDRSGSIFTGYTYTARDYANNVTSPIVADGDLNFGFSTNYSGITCWYQEWARVVDLAHLGVTSGNYYERSNSVRWYESYNEKLAAIKETFNMAISDRFSSYIFINSLCGYLVDSSISESYEIFTGSNTGGIAGNIQALAAKLNPAFYQYVLNSGLEQATGPTGIVMMDYVSANSTDGGSYYLPGVIIANNFKFGSGNGSTGGGNTGGGSGETDNPGGGNGDTGTPGEGGEEEGM